MLKRFLLALVNYNFIIVSHGVREEVRMEKDLTDVPFRLRYHRVMEMIDEALDSVHITRKQILKGSGLGLGEGKVNPIKWGGGDNASGPSSSQSSTMLTGVPPPPELRRQVPVNDKVTRILQHVAVIVAKSNKPHRHAYKKLINLDSTTGLSWSVKEIPSKEFTLPNDEEQREKLYKINYFGKESLKKYPLSPPKPEKPAEPLPDVREADPATGRFEKVKPAQLRRRAKGSWNPVPTATLRRAQLRAEALVEREAWDGILLAAPPDAAPRPAPGAPLRLPRIRYRRASRRAHAHARARGGGGGGGDAYSDDDVEPDPFKSVYGSGSDVSEGADDRPRLWERTARAADHAHLPAIAPRRAPRPEALPEMGGERHAMAIAARKTGRLSLLSQMVRFPHISAGLPYAATRAPGARRPAPRRRSLWSVMGEH